MLDLTNYNKGFLIDDEWMGGVSESADAPGKFIAFVIDQMTGEYVSFHIFPAAADAVVALNKINRAWKFESAAGCNCGTSGCAGTKCGDKCIGESCKKF